MKGSLEAFFPGPEPRLMNETELKVFRGFEKDGR